MQAKFNMIDFQMNSDPGQLYKFEDVDYMEKRKENYKTLQSHVVNMLTDETRGGRREKKAAAVNLNENKLFPKIYQGGQVGVSNDQKKKKLQKIQDFRFFPNPERLKVLIEKELDARVSC